MAADGVTVVYYLPAPSPDTSCDAQIAELLALEESRPPPPPPPRHDHELAHELTRSLHEQEVEELCRQHSAQLAVLPQLLPESPLPRSLSDALQHVGSERLVPAVNAPPWRAAAAPALEQQQQQQWDYASAHAAPQDPQPAWRWEQQPLPEPQPSSRWVPADRQRLELRMTMYGLVERRVKGDGACQFRALSDQLYRTPRLHGFVRSCVVQQLRKRPELYQGFVPDDYQRYCSAMAKPATWGDHAAADCFGLKVSLLTSFQDSCFLEIEPQSRRSERALWLSFWAEVGARGAGRAHRVHYNSLYPAEEPPGELPGEKLLGSRRLYSLLFGPPSPVR
eukprot:scaffold21.g2213.t1